MSVVTRVALMTMGWTCYSCGKRVVVHDYEKIDLLPYGWSTPYRDRTVCRDCGKEWEDSEPQYEHRHFATIEVE